MIADRPLDSFPVIRTTDCDEMRAALATVYARPKLQLAGGRLDARVNECALHETGLLYGAYGGAVALDFPPAGYFLHHLPLRGRGDIACRGRSVELRPGQTCAAISPDSGFKAHYGEGYEALFLKIGARALTRKLAALTGTALDAPLQIELQANGQRMLALCRYLPMLAGTLGDCAGPLPGWWLSQTEQLLMVMFLCGHRHNYSHLLEQEAPDSAPWQVRRAEDFIEANWQAGVSLEDLAEVTGVSGFSLFRSFRKARGYSPFEYASAMRAKRIGSC